MNLFFAVAVAAEICRFGASDAEDPFKRWFSSTDVTCVTDTAVTPPAATIAASFRQGQRGVVYVPRDATAFPLSPNARTVVPANEPLWLFVLEKSNPLGVMDVTPLEAGAERSIDARLDAPPAAVVWLQIPESDRAAVRDARGLSAPSIRAGGRDSDRVMPMNGAFVRIRNVPEGEADIELSGRGWLPQRRRIKVKHPFTAITEPLLARPSAALLVSWSGSRDLASLDASIGACDPKNETPHYEVTIERCATPERPVDPLTCEVFRTDVIPPETHFGNFAIDDLAPGVYRARIKFGHLTPVTSVVNAPGARQTNLSIQARYVTVNGNLTLGGEPLPEDRVLKFPGGIGFSVGKSGEYLAALIERIPLLPADTQIDVAACDGGSKAVVLTDRMLRRGGRYDIDIPDNELTLSVTDTFTREPLVATIKYTLMSLAVPLRPVMTGSMQAATPPGAARMAFVPEREMRISVTAFGYQKQDLDPLTLGKSERRKLAVHLVPLRGDSGKITSAGLFESATLSWFSRNGEQTEAAEVAPDGTFVYASAHDASETMTLVSQSHPLWVSRSPSMKRGDTLQLRFPDGAARSFAIEPRPAPSRYVAVIVGGVRVPLPALRQQQQLRRLSWTTEPAGALRVTVAETGPVDVMLGPPANEVARNAVGMDIFAFPQFANGPRVRLAPGANMVSF